MKKIQILSDTAGHFQISKKELLEKLFKLKDNTLSQLPAVRKLYVLLCPRGKPAPSFFDKILLC